MLNNLFVDCMTMMTVGLTMGWVGLSRNFLTKWWVGLGRLGFENWTHGHVWPHVRTLFQFQIFKSHTRGCSSGGGGCCCRCVNSYPTRSPVHYDN